MSKRRAPANGTALDIRLKKFQPSKMQTNRACIMLGRKGTGKSTLIEDIMWYQQNIPCGCIMSATEEANENFARMAPPLFIYKDFDSEALQSLINRQKKMKKLLKRNNDYLPFDHRAFVILDDCMYVTSLLYPAIKAVLTQPFAPLVLGTIRKTFVVN